jgi:perosamine synthetase
MSAGVPFFRPDLTTQDIEGVVAVMRDGWLTTGPRVKAFEQAFAQAVGAAHAVAVNSCTAALHLALESLQVRAGQAVLVPTMTFAATAEVVRYMGALPILVDCDPVTLQMDLVDAGRKLAAASGAVGVAAMPGRLEVVGIMPVHVGGAMMDIGAVNAFAEAHGLWVVEDAAHAFPAAWRPDPAAAWQRCGEDTAAVTCYSFYANKTITTGEGGMAVTGDQRLADRLRLMSLHGLSRGAWDRYRTQGSWDYTILAPGYKYNLTDVAAALGLTQLARAELMRQARERIALRYLEALADLEAVELPVVPADRLHAWHLFPIRLRLEALSIDRAAFIGELAAAGVHVSVHWRPLHLHPYYQITFGWTAADLPAASAVWPRLVSLPLFSTMSDADIEMVIAAVRQTCAAHRHIATALAS